MPVTIQGLSDSRKTPGINISENVTGGATSTGNQPESCVLYGNMIAAAQSGAAPVFAVAAGTYQVAGAATEVPVLVFTASDALARFGQGSELHLMAAAFFKQYPTGMLYCCPVAEGGGATAATGVLTLTGTSATAAGTVRIYCNGQLIDVGFSTGDTPTVIATAIANAINLNFPSLPVTAQFAAGVLTVTAKQKGTRGNNISFRAQILVYPQAIDVPVSAATVTVLGITAKISATRLGSGTGASAGATADSIANALTASTTQRFPYVAGAHDDTTNINATRDDSLAKMDPTIMKWQQCHFATISTPATALTTSDAINGYRVTLLCQKNAEKTTGEIAAQAAAALMIGDGVAGGSIIGQVTDPASNVDGLLLASINETWLATDRPSATEIESMLSYGVTPVVSSPEHPGYTKIVAAVTTYHRDGNNNFTYAVWKHKAIKVTDRLADRFGGLIGKTYKGFKLRADPADGSPVKLARVVTPNIALDLVKAEAKAAEKDAWITDVDANIALFAANINASNKNRLDMNVPEFPIPDLDIVGVSLQLLS